MSAEISGPTKGINHRTAHVVTIRTCETCMWWAEWSGSEYSTGQISRRMGNCCRKSPKLLTVSDGQGHERTRTKFPNTSVDQFCGDHRPRTISGTGVGPIQPNEIEPPSSHE